MNKTNELSKKIIDLGLDHIEKENNIYLKHLYNEIEFYEYQIKNLKHNNLSKLQKKKIKAQNNKIEEYNNKLIDLYTKLEKEIENSIKE